MICRLFLLTACLCAATLLLASPVAAQDDDSNGAILSYIEDKLSSENSMIRLNGVDGLLASNATINSITIADRDGVWLRIEGVDLVWQRSALLRGRVEIEQLSADKLSVLRAPLPAQSALPTPESQPFALPELPVSINIETLAIDEVEIAEEFIDQPLLLSLAGNVALAGGNLQSNLAIERLDDVGGNFQLIAGFANETRQLELLLNLTEPAGGIAARLLQIPGSPALDFRVEGSGPLSDLDITLDLRADGQPRVVGTATLAEGADGLAFTTVLDGRLDLLVGSAFSPFFAGQSEVSATGLSRTNGGFDLSALKIETGALSVNGSLKTSADGFVEQAVFDGSVGDGVSQTVLPVPGAQVSLRRSEFAVDFGNTGSDAWTARFDTGNLIVGDLTIGQSNITAEGTATDVSDPANRRVTANINGKLEGFDARDPDIIRALGDAITLTVQTDLPSSGPFLINRARLAGNGVDLNVMGEVLGGVFDGKIDANVDRLAPFGGFVQRNIRGALNVALEGTIDPSNGKFDLATNGTGRDLKFDIPTLDDLIKGNTTLKGGISRDEAGLRAKSFSVENEQAKLSADGFFASDAADFTFFADLADLNIISDDAQGPVQLSGSAKGEDGRIALNTSLRMAQGKLLERPVEDVQANFDGRLEDGALRGNVRGDGALGGEIVNLFGIIALDGAENTVESLRLLVGPSVIEGEMRHFAATGLLDGALSVRSSDISGIAALALQEATGAISVDIDLSPKDSLGQQVIAKGSISDLGIQGITLGNGDVDAVVYDAFGVPGVIGSMNFEGLTAFGIDVLSGGANATVNDNKTNFDLTANLANDAAVDLSGSLEPVENGYQVGLNRFGVQSNAPTIALSRPASVLIQNGEIGALDLGLRTGAGRIDAKGSVGSVMDLTLDISEAPIAIVNAFRPDIAGEGSITGAVKVFGQMASPQADFEIGAEDISVAATRDSGLPPIASQISGTLRDGVTTIATEITGPNDLASTINGTFEAQTGALDLLGVLRRFPLILADPLLSRPGLRGTVDGTFQLLGTTSNPRVPFKLQGKGLSARVIRDNAIPAFDASIEGSFFDNRIIIPDARVTGGGGANFNFSGKVPIFEDGLDIFLSGKIPLSIANVPLSESGIRASGLIDIAMNADGNISAPNTRGRLSLAGATVVLPRVNLRLEDFRVDGRFSGDQLRIEQLSARNIGGGQVSASGAIGLNPTRGLPVDLQASLSNMTYTDGRIVTADFDGAFALEGALLRRPTLSGTLNVDNAEVTIPEPQPTERTKFALNITHRNTTPKIAETLSRVPVTQDRAASSGQGSDMVLDLTVNAPSRIFVRGRGLDGEIGGTIKVNGTAQAPSPVGQLNLVRGRIQVLSQRVTMTSGALSFDGDLMPELSLRARTVTDDVEATIGLDGQVIRPKVTFSSVPELPDDEVLARIAFGRSLSTLSPLQIAQVASGAAEFAGRRELSFFDQVRRATGLDDLDFETSSEGATRVRAGKYIRDNVYSTVEADNLGNSKATINLDINAKVKARGSVDNEGNTSLGIFFERDY